MWSYFVMKVILYNKGTLIKLRYIDTKMTLGKFCPQKDIFEH